MNFEECKNWIEIFGAKPVEQIAHNDFGGNYEMDRATVYKLENNKYALVTENGCSCYEDTDADIDLFPTEKAAIESFSKWESQKKKQNHYE